MWDNAKALNVCLLAIVCNAVMWLGEWSIVTLNSHWATGCKYLYSNFILPLCNISSTCLHNNIFLTLLEVSSGIRSHNQAHTFRVKHFLLSLKYLSLKTWRPFDSFHKLSNVWMEEEVCPTQILLNYFTHLFSLARMAGVIGFHKM